MIATGYVVVRKPEFVGQQFGDVPLVLESKTRKGIVYSGIDRDPWWDLDGLFYEKRLSEAELELREKAKKNVYAAFSAGMCSDLLCAGKILKISNRESRKNEIIYAELSTSKRRILKETKRLKYAGLDLYVDGYGSLLRLGVFMRPDLFTDYLDCLDDCGLFLDLEKLLEYSRTYETLPETARLEPVDRKLPRYISYIYSVSEDL